MMKIVILEDNAERQSAMRACLQDKFYQYESVFFDDAHEMQAYLSDHLASALIISLDHDLILKPGSNGQARDSGTGRDVAEFLSSRMPVCPIIIATTNSPAGDGMEFLLGDAHWQTHRVFPWDDLEWIDSELERLSDHRHGFRG